ncbi:melatonin receptor type 1B-B-like isoform X1 [Entelurus aequoreus]|uniref:melatonin receptor type 1B-B-like isoform X1 n=1 Tax=Entelurus aequoreus TaxID=161455 RepID=UPI002B1D00FF|nr:melatonin receptor type 1B-B-like isoform X1 [Entelurus aequoreus]
MPDTLHALLLHGNRTTLTAAEESGGRPAWVIGVLASVLIFTTVVDVLGNLLVIISVFRNRKLRNSGNVFVVSLAFADLVVAFYPYPLVLYALFHDGWALGNTQCMVSGFLMGLSVIGSIFNITGIAVNRYCYICHSFSYSRLYSYRNTLMLVALIWLLTVVAIVPNFFVGSLRYDPRVYSCTFAQNVSSSYTVAVVVVHFLVPIAVVTFCYLRIWILVIQGQTVALCDQSVRRSELSCRCDAKSRRRRVPACDPATCATSSPCSWSSCSSPSAGRRSTSSAWRWPLTRRAWARSSPSGSSWSATSWRTSTAASTPSSTACSTATSATSTSASSPPSGSRASLSPRRRGPPPRAAAFAAGRRRRRSTTTSRCGSAPTRTEKHPGSLSPSSAGRRFHGDDAKNNVNATSGSRVASFFSRRPSTSRASNRPTRLTGATP